MTNESNDVLEQVARFAPDEDRLEQLWPASRRGEVVERIRRDELGGSARLRHRSSPRSLRSPRRRLVAVTSMVAAAILAAVVLPALVPQSTPGGARPAAAALEQLAQVAANTPADLAAPGDFVHTVVRNHQVGRFADGAPYPGTYDLEDRSESWTGSEGQVWRRDITVAKNRAGEVVGGGTETLMFPASMHEHSYNSSLPTDAEDLEAHLRTHVQGSSSQDEAVFGALGDVLRSTTAPAELRSAALSVLARVNHVSLGNATTDSQGRAIREFVFADDTIRPGVTQRFYIDPRTAQLLEERITQDGLVNTTTVLTSDTTNAVPRSVTDEAASQD